MMDLAPWSLTSPRIVRLCDAQKRLRATWDLNKLKLPSTNPQCLHTNCGPCMRCMEDVCEVLKELASTSARRAQLTRNITQECRVRLVKTECQERVPRHSVHFRIGYELYNYPSVIEGDVVTVNSATIANAAMSRPFEDATIGHIGDNLRFHCGKCVVKTGMISRIHERGYPFCKCDITTAGAFEYFSLYMCIGCFIETKRESEKLREKRRKGHGPRSYQVCRVLHVRMLNMLTSSSLHILIVVTRVVLL